VIASSCPAWLWSPMLPIWLSLIDNLLLCCGIEERLRSSPPRTMS
jgi:hypothetical protein